MTDASNASAVRVIVSIDTEEDNWIPARQGATTRNIDALPDMHAWLTRLGVRPTYFTAHEVLANPRARDVMRGLRDAGNAQVAAHLHPWNTPPLTDHAATMLLRLPEAVQAAKLATVTESLTELLGHHPQGFRAGRFGLGASTVRALIAAGYTIDSSVTPMRSWAAYDDGPSFVGAPAQIYHTDGSRDPIHDVGRGLTEVPISSGYHRGNVDSWLRTHDTLNTPLARRLHLAGIAARLGIARSVILSPEVQTSTEMAQLSTCLIRGGVPYLHVFWHSQSATPGLSPFARDVQEVARLRRRLEEFLERIARIAPLRFVTLGEAVAELMPGRA